MSKISQPTKPSDELFLLYFYEIYIPEILYAWYRLLLNFPFMQNRSNITVELEKTS